MGVCSKEQPSRFAPRRTQTISSGIFDTNERSLKRATNGAYTVMAVAQFITNTVIFTSENFAGTILTENQNNRVIGLTLQFYQIRYPVIHIGPGNYYMIFINSEPNNPPSLGVKMNMQLRCGKSARANEKGYALMLVLFFRHQPFGVNVRWTGRPATRVSRAKQPVLHDVVPRKRPLKRRSPG